MNKVYQIVTDKILSELRSGRIPWERPWNVIAPQNMATKTVYRGMNNLLLGFLPYKFPFYVTFKQCSSMGYRVKPSSEVGHGHPITFWRQMQVDDPKTGNLKSKTIPMLRYYTVFNVAQTTIPESEYPKIAKLDFVPNEKAEKVANDMPNRPAIEHQGARACYSPMSDQVTMPPRETFKNVPEYYTVLFHELGHSTGHKSRLDRDLKAGVFNNSEYSFEELVAELTACFVTSACGLEMKIQNRVAYLQSWLGRLEDNPDWIVKAAGKAQKAADYILGVANETPKEAAEVA